ncbi:MAG: hypothetical protein DHS20C17_12330 [Cyclobacteriaceae bacterium]|nr:MAG: hypothetical protein DHS20C17_12330 [Cyclobacteriaceae bacterium]
MKSKKLNRKIVILATGLVIFLLTSCAQTTYVYQNGTTYNDYEVATNYRIKSATKQNKVQHSKAPNWKKYNQQNKYKRYN